jgi:hypothetical protein
MDEGGVARIGFVGAHGDAFELLELGEKVLDQVTPFVHFFVDRQFAGSPLMLGDDDLGASLVEIGDDGVAVEGCVGDQCAKAHPIDQWRHADGVEPMPGQKNEAYEIAESVSQREDFGRQASFGTSYGLALSPPFAPCPWRWTLTIVASTMAYSMSGSSEQASKSRTKTSALTQSRYRLNIVFHLPNKAGRSRQGLPVRTIHSTASTNNRLSLPLRPGSVRFPRQCGSIFAHWASVTTNRSIQSLNHEHAQMRILNLNKP